MKPRVLALLAAMVFALVAHPVLSYAQDVGFANIDFQFVAAGKTMAPGRCGLRVTTDRAALTLTPPKGSGEFLVSITRLAAPEPASSETRLGFDKVGDIYYLSEVWLPGDDGFLVYAAKETHTHRTVKGEQKAKH